MINTLEDLKIYLTNNKFENIFLLCGKNSFLNSGAKKFINTFFKKKNFKIRLKVNEIPKIDELIEIIDEIRYFKPDLILAIGGGSIIDYAKIANVVEKKKNLKELIINYSYPFEKKYTKLAVIPTTAGSGAEVTSNAVIYVDNIKYSFESNLLMPDAFFLIPEFLISAPFKIKSSAGFDAVAQALESLISKKSNDKSIDYAVRSLKISLNNFIPFLKNTNLENASQMALASNFAGKAINISKTTLPHATSYPFSSLFNISHGHAVSLFFEKFLKFNFQNLDQADTNFNLKKRYDLIFSLFKVKNIEEFCQSICDIKKEANLDDDLNNLNINVTINSDKIINGINFLRLKNNPVKIDKNQIFKIISSKK